MKKYFTFKKILIYLVIFGLLAAISFNFFSNKTNPEDIITETVKQQDLKQTVLATGQVTSTTDLALSFKTGGLVNGVNVKVGEKVKTGQILANLEQKDQIATLTQARGSLAQAKANLDRVLAGASNEEIRVAEKAVNSAEVTLTNAKKNLEVVKSQQSVVVKNAYNALLNSSPEALANPNNFTKPTVTVSGSYIGNKEGTYIITIYGSRFAVSGIETADSGTINPNIPIPIGRLGLYITFSTTALFTGDSWSITLPNTKAATYTSNLNIYTNALESQRSAIENSENAISTAEVALEQAKANLALKKSQARPAEIASAQAQILSAQGQVQAAESSLENTVIRSPSAGTITAVDIKPGELATAQKAIIKLQDVENLHVEANISEANIANLVTGQQVSMTLDAFGENEKFIGTVQTIDPASTVISGVVNYKVVVGLSKLDSIKPGMTANMVILVKEKPQVLVVPSRAILTKENKKIVRVITDAKLKTFKEVEVMTGLEGDDGLVEIVSGLTSGQEIVALIKK